MTTPAKVLIVYFSTSGKTEKMAHFIAEGVRFSGNQTTLKKVGELQDAAELDGYDGYIVGSPTFSLAVPKPVDTFLQMVAKAGLADKMGAAFGPYTHDASYSHDSHAPALIGEKLLHACGMKLFELGPLALQEELLDTREGMKACQDYGRVFGEKLGE